MKITNTKKAVLLGLALGLVATQSAIAENIAWTDWEAATTGNSGSATGTINSVEVKYSGHVSFAQLGDEGDVGSYGLIANNFWTEGTPPAYTGISLIDNAPTANELIATDLAGRRTITFNPPVQNPILAILSMGRSNLALDYTFDQEFEILNEGRGYWGDGTLTKAGKVLTGLEAHGVIQFQGTLSTISWDSSPNEFWHGITVGLPDQTRHVDINVHPNSDPNPLNLQSGGSTPVAIFGSADLDVYDIDTSTLKLGDAEVKVVGKKNNELCSYEDIGSYDEAYFDNLNPTPDGVYDLLCKFDTYDIFMSATEGEILEVVITGDTWSGDSFKGSDAVKIVKYLD